MSFTSVDFTIADLVQLLAMMQYPERTKNESRVLRDYLMNHAGEFDRFQFAAHIGPGTPPDPTLPLKLQKQQTYISQQKIDLLAWKGSQPTIVEAKYLVTPASLGQIFTYRLLLRREIPDAPEPQLVVIGAASTPTVLDALQEHGITVYLYPSALTPADAAGRSV